MRKTILLVAVLALVPESGGQTLLKPAKRYVISGFGATADGTAVDTKLIQAVIA